MITVLGTGLLGSGFARALVKRGNTVRVWNRTFSRAEALAEHGATPVADPAEAVRGATRVHVVVSDDAAVDGVLAAAAPGLAKDTLVFDHSTTSPGGAAARTESWRARGVMYVHAPVFMGPGNALESTGFMLISEARDLAARVLPLLAPMTGKVLEVGDTPGRAAGFKLIGNLMLMGLSAAFMDIIALAESMGMTAKEAGTLFDMFNPGTQVPVRYKRFTDAVYEQPSWDLGMARKDAYLMKAETDRAGYALMMLPQMIAKMDAMMARGFSELDWTVVGKDLVKPD